ncbi:MAG: DUF2569 domain-containing protein [Parcubacteria group bacterium]|nr:DUF2569 domain-containing protein [Parcubacteria group bacterium]
MSYPTKQELENKKWYRLVKVVFIIVSIFLIGLSINSGFLVYEEYAPYKVNEDVIIKCDSGKEFKAKEVVGNNNPFDIFTKTKEINNKCEGIKSTTGYIPILTKGGYIPIAERKNSSSDDLSVKKKYHTFSPYHMEGSYFINILLGFLMFIISLGISAFIIWITHKTMLYIIYGSKDKKSRISYCKKCGKKLNKKTKFCNNCRTKVYSNVNNKAVLNNNVVIKSKEFNFWKIYTYITGGILVLLTIFFGLVGSYKEGLWDSFIGIVFLSGLLGILVTFIVKWSKKGFVYEDKSVDLNEKEISQYKGLGGWLILVVIGLFITVFLEAYNTYDSIILFMDGTIKVLINPISELYIPGYFSVLKFEFIVGILFLVFAVYLVFLFFKKSKKFPKYYIFFLIVLVIYTIIDYVILSSLTISSNEIKQIFNEVLSEQETEIGRIVIVAIIWVLYITKSKRVKATFIKD